jgi:heterodisulfide reductase subunit A-like polyferredoxin
MLSIEIAIMSFKVGLFTGILLVMSACGTTPKRIPMVKLNGINGEALYTIDSSGEVVLVIKELYQTSDYNIAVVSDTMALGEDFVGMFAIMKDRYKVNITSPSIKEIEGNDENYVFTTSKVGLHQYRGQIEYDSTVVPFSYDFIVVP